MDAKAAKKHPKPSIPSSAVPATPASESQSPGDPAPAWLESADPRKRAIGKVLLAGVWLYVAAIWLLALDQTFHWGIFDPKLPPAL
jgi:hypothetical protein